MRGRRPVLSARSGKVRARWTGRVHVRGSDRARGGWARPRRAGVADGPAPGGTVVGPEGGAAPAAPARRRRAGTPTTRPGDRARGAAPVRRARHAWPAVPVRRRRPGFPVDAPYAVIDVETTGFSPAAGDRIVEVAIARVDAHGRIEDEYATLVDPGRDVGPVFVHGISNTEVLGAPTFADIAGELLDRMDGAVVVAHNATFEERFLAAEFARMGLALPLNPALCSLWLARRTLQAPNHKLTTLARVTGLSTAGAHTALGDVRTVAALLPQMLAAHGEPPRSLTGP